MEAPPPLFSSKRERRLWAWAVAVVAGIYATLGLAQTLAGLLRDRDLLDAFFAIGMLLVAATIAIQGLKTRPGVFAIGIALGVAAVYLLVFLRITIAEERTHLIEYSVVAILILEALRERASHGRRVPNPALLAVVLTALAGTLDECIQAVLPDRVFDYRDIGFNALAGTMAVGASAVLTWARRRIG